MTSGPEQRYVPIETPLGELRGRDAIYLDEVSIGEGVLTLRGELNGRLLSQPRESYVGYALTFNGLIAFSMTTLEASAEFGASSFDEVLHSGWLRNIRNNVEPDVLSCDGLRHFFIRTYDDVFSVICREYELLLN